MTSGDKNNTRTPAGESNRNFKIGCSCFSSSLERPTEERPTKSGSGNGNGNGTIIKGEDILSTELNGNVVLIAKNGGRKDNSDNTRD